MNTEQIKGNWKQLVGKAKETWGRLTDDDWKVVEGKWDQLVGKIQERYGIAAKRRNVRFASSREPTSGSDERQSCGPVPLATARPGTGQGGRAGAVGLRVTRSAAPT
jgi:uncharacterized protein YjbJ (UPF0337 family)